MLRRAGALWFAVLTWATTGHAQSSAFSYHRASPPSPRHSTGRNIALLIGVSDYEYFEPNGPAGESDLEGPRNDVPRMKLALERWGFAGDSNVHVLTDSQASRAGILAAFDWVVRTATDPNDAVVIYWSGHGSWAPDEDGDEAKLDPLDKDDEALVPWDARDIHDPRQLVLDDDIKRFLDTLKTKNVTVIVDACYSGTITRGAGPRPRGPLPPKGGGRGGLDATGGPTNHVLFTAASANQSSYEVRFGADSTTAFGVFTYFLTEAMNRADVNARADEVWHDVAELVRTYPHSIGQSPQLEGVGNSRLFHVNGDVARLPFVSVSSRGAVVVLGAGAVHGVRVGAQYEVFAPNDSRFEGSPLGRVVVDTVNAVDAIARIDSGGPFPANARAILARTPPGATVLQRLDVFVDPSASHLQPALQRYSWLHLTTSRGAPVEVSLVGGVLRVVHRGLELVPVEASQVAQTTIVADNSRRVVSGFRPNAPLCEPMARAFAVEALSEIHNPSPPPPRLLDLRLRLVPAGKRPSEQNTAVVDTAWIGESYDLYARVDAPPKSLLYTTIGLEGLTAKAGMLYPSDSASNGLFPLNKWVPVRGGLVAHEPPGTDVLKAVVSSRQYDFASLLRAMPVCERAVSKRFTESADLVNGWTETERRVVFVRRKSR